MVYDSFRVDCRCVVCDSKRPLSSSTWCQMIQWCPCQAWKRAPFLDHKCRLKGVSPYQRTPENGKSRTISRISRGNLWVFSSPRIPREHNKYHGYTVRGTPNCPLIVNGCLRHSVGDFMVFFRQWAFIKHSQTHLLSTCRRPTERNNVPWAVESW